MGAIRDAAKFADDTFLVIDDEYVVQLGTVAGMMGLAVLMLVASPLVGITILARSSWRKLKKRLEKVRPPRGTNE